MTKVIAKLTNIRHSPRKMRVAANQIKNMEINKAQQVLAASTLKAAKLILPVLNSAIANARNNFNLDLKDLKIFEVQIGDGRRMKKMKYRARGRGDTARSRFSNLRLTLITTK